LEGSGHGLNIGTTPAFGQRDCEKPVNPSVRIANVQTEIQTEHLSNLSPQHYHYAIYLNFQSNNRVTGKSKRKPCQDSNKNCTKCFQMLDSLLTIFRHFIYNFISFHNSMIKYHINPRLVRTFSQNLTVHILAYFRALMKNRHKRFYNSKKREGKENYGI
jgi:hypothetical protein